MCFYFNGSWSNDGDAGRERKSFSEILVGGVPRDL